jgi:tripartite-type tricarboxylate transporter receptor subunit TctC
MMPARLGRILGGTVAALLLTASAASAADYPARAVRVICPFPAGGTADIIARLVAQQLQEASSHPVVVENRPGAAGNIGADLVAKADPDGYTLLVSPPPPLAVNISLYKTLPFDSRTAFAHISVVAQSPSVLVVNPKTPYNSLAELIAYAKANPGKVNYASQGNGTTSHLTAAMLNKAAAVNIAHIPYRGSAPALTDLLAGQVDIMFDNLGSSLTHVRSGALRALAVGSTERAEGLRDVPTMIEAGFPGFVSVAWFGAAAPARTPPDIVKFISGQIAKGLKKPETRERLAGIGVYPVGSTPQEMTKFVAEETARWRDVIEAAGVKLE